MNMKAVAAYLKAKITGWYKNAKIDYDVNGKLIDTIFTGDTVKIVWEEEGTRYAMTLNWKNWMPEVLYDIWMEADWDIEVA